MRISTRLTLSFALAASIAVIVAAYSFFGTTADLVESQYQRSLFDAMAFLEPQAHDWFLGDSALADAAVDRIASDLTVRVTLIRPDGHVIGDTERSGAELGEMEDHRNRPEVVTALESGTGASFRVSGTLGIRLLYCAKAITEQGRIIGILRLSIPLDEMHQISRLRLRYLGSGLVAVLAASFILAAILNTWFLKPIVRLQRAAAAIASGDHHVSIGELGRDEIGELGMAVQRIAETLRQSIRRLESESFRQEAVFGSLKEGVIALDAQGFVMLANEAARQLLGEPEALAGRDVFDYFRQPQVTGLLTRLVQRGQGGETEIALDDVSSRVLRLSAMPVSDKAEGLSGLLVITDVTAQVATLRMRRDFFSNASHELRTPLTSILGYLETLDDSLPADSPLRSQFLDVLQRQADRMRRIIDDLLLLARVESEQWPVQTERYDLVPQVLSLLESFQPEARKNKQSLEVDHPDAPVWVTADRDKLNVVISNLLDNALKYSGQGAHVKVSIKPDDSSVQVTVSDDGPGIPPDQKHRIFERFYRVDKSRSRQLGGTGLGLSIVRHILAAHGIEIEVDSDLGAGTRFQFRLPRAA